MTHFTDNFTSRDKLIRKVRIVAKWQARTARRFARDNPQAWKEYTERELCWRQKWRETEQQVNVAQPNKELP